MKIYKILLRKYRALPKFAQKVLALTISFSIIFTSGGVIYLFGPWHPKAEAAWYNDSWLYRQAITITNNGSAQTNYQVATYIDTQTLIAAGKLQSDCDDLRFANSSATTYSYWLEYCSNTASKNSIAWVTIPTLAAGTTTIYVYYGNTSAAAVSAYSSAPTGINVGDGEDGDITTTADTNINTDDKISGRTCSDTYGGDAPIYTTTTNTAAASTTITLVQTPSSGCLDAGDEILIANMRGTTGDNSNVGKYETARITNIATNVLTINRALTNTYDGTTQKIVIQRIPNYDSVSVDTSGEDFTPSAWDGTTNFRGGIMAFRTSGTVSIASGATINTNAKGYAGGGGGAANENGGSTGESYDGISTGASGDRGGSGGSSGEGRGGGRAGNGAGTSPADGAATSGGGGGGSDGSVNTNTGGGGGGGGGGHAGGGGGGGANRDGLANHNNNGADGGTAGASGGGVGTAAGGGGGGCTDTNSANTPGAGGNAGSGGSNAASCGGTNGTGGGVGSGATQGSGGGGGGGNTGSGAGGGGGGIIGNATLTSQMYFGAGGGGGGGSDSTDNNAGTAGGTGGGIVFIAAGTVTVTGTITATGGSASAASLGAGTGGGGAGGSVLIMANTATLGSSLTTAVGGTGGGVGARRADGGDGGAGRIAVYHGDSGTETTSPTAGTDTNPPYAAAPTAEETTPTLALYWKFDDATGTTTQDQTTNGFDGTLNNTPTWKTAHYCISNNCLYFDGTTNQNVSKSDNSLLDFGATYSFTIEAWAKRDGASSANNFIVTKAQSGYTGYKLYQDASGDYCFDVRDGTNTDSACTSAVDFDDDQWHQVLGVKTGTTKIELYVDGNLRATDSSIAATGTLANTGTFYAGVDLDGTSNEWLGFLDEIKVYSYARSAAQILADYNARSVIKGASTNLGSNVNDNLATGLLGYWAMDESSWTGSCDGSGSTLDSSGNNFTLDDCPLVGGPSGGASGKFGRAGSFDGTNDYLYRSNTSDLTLTGNFTISTWLKPSDGQPASERYILSKWYGGANARGYALALQTDGKLKLYLSSDGTSSASMTTDTAVFTDGANTQWKLVTVIYNTNQTISFYIDGILVSSTVSGTIPTSLHNNSASAQFMVASTNDGGTIYPGSLDDLRVYNRVLSNQEVQNLYNWAPNPVGYWRLDENTGTAAQDASGYDNQATLTNSPTWGKGKFGAGVDFAGSNQHITRADDADFDFGTGQSFTYEAYVKHNTSPSTVERIITKYDNTSGNGGYALQMETDGDLTCGIDDDEASFPEDSATSTAATYDDNNWHHVACVKDGTSGLYLYIDGILVASDASLSSTGDFANADPLYIGIAEDGTSNDYIGSIDEPKIYNYARTPKQILEDMNAGHPVGGSPVGSQVSYWKFDDATGTTAYDSIANANNLTLSSASWNTSGKFGTAWNGTGSVWLSRADDDDLDFAAAEDFSIGLWFKSDSASNPGATEYLVSKGPGSTTAGYAVYANTSGNICFGVDDDTTWGPDDSVCSSSDIYDNTWHYVLAKKTGTTRLDLYVDGRPDGTPDTSIAATATLANSSTFYVGDFNGTDNGNEFNGDLDEVKVYRAALNDGEVTIDYNRNASQVLGASGTTAAGLADSSVDRAYCPPGDTTASCGPVGDWNMDEKTGTTAYDKSGNGNDLTLTNTPTYTTGKFGAGIAFAGSNQQLTRADDADFDFGAGGSFAIQTWFRHTTASAQEIIMAKYNEAGYKLIMESDGDITCGIDYDATWSPTDSVTSTAATYDDNAWHFITCVKNANTDLRLYIDGKLIGTDATLTNATLANSDPIYLGIDADGTSNDFTGSLDQARIYNYARTQAQVAWDYNRGAPVGWWKMDECTGTTLNDASGNGNSITLTVGATGTYTSAGTCTDELASSARYVGRNGKRNYALAMDGTDDHGITGTAPQLSISQMTLSAWVYFPTSIPSGWRSIFVHNTSGANYYSLYKSNNANTFEFRWSGSSSDFTSTIVADTWYHVVGTYDGTNAKMYLNGRLDRTVANSSIGTPTDATMRLGSKDGAIEFFQGYVDDIRIYNYPMTATQVQMLYNDGAVRFGPTTGAP